MDYRGKMWEDLGRCGKMWEDVGRCHLSLVTIYTSFYVRNLSVSVISQSVWFSQMFVVKAKSLPLSTAPESFFTQVGSGVT
jgi:hypothetical protein